MKYPAVFIFLCACLHMHMVKSQTDPVDYLIPIVDPELIKSSIATNLELFGGAPPPCDVNKLQVKGTMLVQLCVTHFRSGLHA